MRFNLKTIVDVTETKARRGEGEKEVNQQANFMTVYQTIGMRSNPTNFKIEKIKGTHEGFGSIYKNIKHYWNVEFDIEYGGLELESLIEDFDLVPFIQGLDESVKFKDAVFFTKNSSKINIIFSLIDK